MRIAFPQRSLLPVPPLHNGNEDPGNEIVQDLFSVVISSIPSRSRHEYSQLVRFLSVGILNDVVVI